MNWAVSSRSASSVLMCSWEDVVQPLRSPWPIEMDSIFEVSSGNPFFSIRSAMSNSLRGSTLFRCMSRIILFSSAPSGSSLGRADQTSVVGDRAYRQQDGVHLDPQFSERQLILSHSLATFLASPLDTSLVPTIRVTVKLWSSLACPGLPTSGRGSSSETQDSCLPMGPYLGQHPHQAIPYN